MKIGVGLSKNDFFIKFEDSWYNFFDSGDFKIIREMIKELLSKYASDIKYKKQGG